MDVGSGPSGIPGDFAGFDFGTEDDIGDEIDVVYNRTINENFGFEAGVAVFMPGDAVTILNGGPDDDVTRIWAQVRLRF